MLRLSLIRLWYDWLVGDVDGLGSGVRDEWMRWGIGWAQEGFGGI
jgi:hypothetical protein